MPWESVKCRFHGQAAVTGMIPNQIYINKMFAMAMQHVKMMAFPKMVYDKAKIPGGWTNRVGAAIPVVGDPNTAVAGGLRLPDMSAQVLETIDKVMAYTKDTMGASDAALGNVKADNTSAIIAVQKASSMPLELQKMSFYRLVEDSVRIFLDMMAANYGLRRVWTPADSTGDGPAHSAGDGGTGRMRLFNFASLRGLNLRLNVDIGAATYWSELVQVQTLDNLFERGIIPDAETYLELVPTAYIKDKAFLLEAVRRAQAGAGQDQAGGGRAGGEGPNGPVGHDGGRRAGAAAREGQEDFL